MNQVPCFAFIFSCCCHLVAKWCLTLFHPHGPPGSCVHGISQARILEWVTLSFSRGSSWPRDQTHISCIACRSFTTEPPGKPLIFSCYMLGCFSCVQLFAPLWTVAHQAPSSVGFSRQEYWSGSPCSPPGDLPDPGLEPTSFVSLHWQAGSLPLGTTHEAQIL